MGRILWSDYDTIFLIRDTQCIGFKFKVKILIMKAIVRFTIPFIQEYFISYERIKGYLFKLGIDYIKK